jgi:hypothetical protein
MSLEERLWSKTWIDESHTYNGQPCWRWSGGKNKNGYGVINITYNVVLVHLLVVSIYLGLDLDDPKVQACHHCDVPDCWNPGHLFLGDQLDNNSDMYRKGRHGNSNKTLCPRGHKYDSWNNRGQRTCSICQSIRSKEYWLRKKSKDIKELIQ